MLSSFLNTPTRSITIRIIIVIAVILLAFTLLACTGDNTCTSAGCIANF